LHHKYQLRILENKTEKIAVFPEFFTGSCGAKVILSLDCWVSHNNGVDDKNWHFLKSQVEYFTLFSFYITYTYILESTTEYYEETELNALINIDIDIIAPNANNPNYVHTTKIAFNSLEIIGMSI